ncbi:MAG TPA: DMT family transporter [Nevskiaceae bacterium]|nr:DMT family transporter [Nevskiaceae bacterium]
MSGSTAAPPDPRADAAGGLAFVVLWSSGYIAAAFGLAGAGPFTLAVARFLGTVLLIGVWLAIRAAARPARGPLAHAMVAGLLLQAGFFGFAYAGMRAGVPAAAAGLICGLMPLVTALIAAIALGEPLRRAAIVGLVVGLAGVLLVVLPDLRGPSTPLGYGFLLLALLSLSLGTVYQKRFVTGLDARLSLVVQVMAALLAMLPFAWWLEGFTMHVTPPVLGAIAWVVLVNSCCGLLLYLWLINRGAASRVSSLFYLVPPVTAVMAAVVLGAQFTTFDAAGFGLAAAGVWLGQRE